MRDKLNQVRALLDELEQEANASADASAIRVLSGLELPDILMDMVDLLLPNLTPYQATIYLYLFRHSVIATGTPYIRVSSYRLQNVFKSAYAESRSGGTAASQAKISKTLRQLESLGAIRKEGEPNRDGTLYRLLLPEEIESCEKLRKERAAAEPPVRVSNHEIDYYNVRANRVHVYERDGYKCKYCGKQLTRFTATLDHIKPVSEGGNNGQENLLTACRECNSKKNARLLGDFMADTNPTK